MVTATVHVTAGINVRYPTIATLPDPGARELGVACGLAPVDPLL